MSDWYSTVQNNRNKAKQVYAPTDDWKRIAQHYKDNPVPGMDPGQAALQHVIRQIEQLADAGHGEEAKALYQKMFGK